MSLTIILTFNVLAAFSAFFEVKKGVIKVSDFQSEPMTLAIGMLAVLLGASTWVMIATWKGMPISTTHAIIGSLVGIGIVFSGLNGVNWRGIINIVLSWLISPFVG